MYKISLKFLVYIGLVMSVSDSYAGTFKIGVMGGVNSALNSFSFKEPIRGYDSKLGFNANAFARIGFAKFIIQPELGYLYNRASFSFLENGKVVDADLNLGQMYMTAMPGLKFGNIRFTAGPLCTFTAIQSTDQVSSVSSFISLVENDQKLTWGGVVNLGIDITKKLSIDAKILRTFTSTDYKALIQNSPSTFEGNTGMISLSIGYALFKLK
jgi:hypothetical protein